MQQNLSIDSVQEYWDRRPCNIRHSSKEVGTKDYFDEVEKRKYFVEPHIPTFASFADWNGKRVLEIGCGIGTDAVNFARAGAEYTGVELSIESLKVARKRFEIFSLEGNFVHADCENLDNSFQGATFDLIYSFGVLHHTPSLGKALEQIGKLCNAKSSVKVMLYAKNSWKQIMIDARLDQPEAQAGCPIANSYLKEEVEQIFKSKGLQVNNIEQTHIFPYRIAEYREYRYVKEPWFENMPENVFSALEASLGWHLLIDAQPVS